MSKKASKIPIPEQLTELPNAWRLTKSAAKLIADNRRIFIGITIIYGLLNLILVQGLATSTDVSSLKNQLNQAFTGDFGQLASGLSIFVVLVGSAGNGSSQVAGAYQFFLFIIASLATIWSLRQISANKTIRIKYAFYSGMYPLIPFILVLLVIGLQLVPLLIGSSLYSVVITNGIAVMAIEKVLWATLFALLAGVSIYLVSSSIFALYIVTLPEMTPMKALRSAKQLVKGRRWPVLRKLIYLPFMLFVLAALIMIPIIILITPLAQWIFFVMTMFGLIAAHSYIYTLYRELLNE